MDPWQSFLGRGFLAWWQAEDVFIERGQRSAWYIQPYLLLKLLRFKVSLSTSFQAGDLIFKHLPFAAQHETAFGRLPLP